MMKWMNLYKNQIVRFLFYHHHYLYYQQIKTHLKTSHKKIKLSIKIFEKIIKAKFEYLFIEQYNLIMQGSDSDDYKDANKLGAVGIDQPQS